MRPLEALIAKLTTARELWDKKGEEDERAAAVLALQATINFAYANGLSVKLLAPLIGLSGALEDAANGNPNPLTKPVSPGPSGKKPKQESWDRGSAAAALEVLLNAGADIDAAKGRIAKETGIGASTLKSLRKNIPAGTAAQEVIRCYNFTLEKVRALYPDDPEEQVRQIVKGIQDWNTARRKSRE